MYREKIDELAIFVIGLGIIGGLLFAWLAFTGPTNAQRSIAVFAIPFAVAGLLVGLGFAIKHFRNKVVIYAALVLVCILFGGDLLLGFNPVKALISGGILFMVVKTGRLALREADGY